MNKPRTITVLFDDTDVGTVLTSAEFSQEEMQRMIYGWDSTLNPDGTVVSITGEGARILEQHVIQRQPELTLEDVFPKPRNRHERRKLAKTGEI